MTKQKAAPPLWGIQYRDWLGAQDWVDWEPFDEVAGSLGPLRFPSKKTAAECLDALIAAWMAQDAVQREQRKRARALHRARVKALKAADLWVQEGETPERVMRTPLLPPRRFTEETWRKHMRVARDQQMEWPVAHHLKKCECEECAFGDAPLWERVHVPRPASVQVADHDAFLVEMVLCGVKVDPTDLDPGDTDLPDFALWW